MPARNESLSYRYLGGWKEAAELDFSVPGGAGSILSTPTDMTKFIQALFDLKLVSEDSLKRMTTMRDGEGMGMEPFSFAGKTLYGHTGGSGSSGAWLAYYPEEKLALAYTTNMKIYPVDDIVSGVFDIYWNRPFEIPTFDAVEVSPEVLDRYVGVYSTRGRSRETDHHPAWQHAVLSAARAIRCTARSDGSGQIQDRSRRLFRIRRRERPDDDQTTWG